MHDSLVPLYSNIQFIGKMGNLIFSYHYRKYALKVVYTTLLIVIHVFFQNLNNLIYSRQILINLDII